MTYYKIIINSEVVSVNIVFVRWDDKHRCMMYCDIDDAQFVQKHDGTALYHANWLKSYPARAGQYEEAEVVVINKEEYDELLALIIDGDPIPQPEPEPTPEPTPGPEPDPEPDIPMSLDEIREIVKRMNDQDQCMTVSDNIPIGSYFSIGNRIYLATQSIVSGSTIIPNHNCKEVKMADVVNILQREVD